MRDWLTFIRSAVRNYLPSSLLFKDAKPYSDVHSLASLI